VPYQVKLDGGGSVFVPEDEDDLIRKLPVDEGDGAEIADAMAEAKIGIS
jgi:hypothetical protein